MLEAKGLFPFLIFLSIFCRIQVVSAYEIEGKSNDESRLAGFSEQEKINKNFDKQRLSDVDDIKKDREAWEKKRQRAIEKFKQEKSERLVDLNEKNAAYREDMREKRQQDRELEKARQEYVKKRDAARNSVKKNIHISEAHEYGLDEKIIRTNKNKRKVLAGPGGSAGSSSGAAYSPPAYTPPSDFGGTSEFEAPPPPPPPMNTGAPEFFEPENNVGVPPADSFEEPIPPPIFDEPEF
jgi:hypothetical protein